MRLERLAQPFSPWQSWPPASTPGPCWARWPAGPGGLLAISPPRRLDPLELQPAPPSLALSRSTSLVSSQTLTFSHHPFHFTTPPITALRYKTCSNVALDDILRC